MGGWLSLFWLALFWLMSMDDQPSLGLGAFAAVASVLAVCVNTPDLWLAAGAGHPGDSFWTLSRFGRAGVAAIALLGLTGIYLLSGWKSRWLLRGGSTSAALLVLDLTLGLLIFAVLFALSPQVFYTFYQLLFDGLPPQWQIDPERDIARLIGAMRLDRDAPLSEHLAGVGVLGLIPFTCWYHARTMPGMGPKVMLLGIGWFGLQIANAV